MRYEYKVIDITEDKENDKSEIMRAMSLKKLQKKLDHTKEYAIEYVNKHNNFISFALYILFPLLLFQGIHY